MLAQPLTEMRRPAPTQTLASACPAGCIAVTIAGGAIANTPALPRSSGAESSPTPSCHQRAAVRSRAAVGGQRIGVYRVRDCQKVGFRRLEILCRCLAIVLGLNRLWFAVRVSFGYLKRGAINGVFRTRYIPRDCWRNCCRRDQRRNAFRCRRFGFADWKADPAGPTPAPLPNCTAADLAQVSAGVAAATSAYLFSHPDVNAYFTSLKGQPRSDRLTRSSSTWTPIRRRTPTSKAFASHSPTSAIGATWNNSEAVFVGRERLR